MNSYAGDLPDEPLHYIGEKWLRQLEQAEQERDRLKHEIEFVVALGQPYGISLQLSWIERLQNVLLSLGAAAGEGET